MDPFFIYVSIGALVLLILILVLVGVSMSQLQSLIPFPPTQNACPDYWDVSSNPGYCGIPVESTMMNRGLIDFKTGSSKGVNEGSIVNIGMCSGADKKNFGCGSENKLGDLSTVVNPANFQYIKLNNNTQWGTLYPGLTERCAQKNWANTLNIKWDGVTNYNGC